MLYHDDTKDDDPSRLIVTDLSVNAEKSEMERKTDESNDNNSNNDVFVLPRCALPTTDEFRIVETFVANAFQQAESTAEGEKEGDEFDSILKNIKEMEDPPMTKNVLIAFRSAGNGSILHKLTTKGVDNQSKFTKLRHFIFKIDPFRPPRHLTESSNHNDSYDSEMEEEEEERKEMLKPYEDYSLAEAYLHLLLAIVSSNTTFLRSALQRLWSLLTGANYIPLTQEGTKRIHATLATLTRLCPKTKMELFPVMAAQFPYYTRPAEVLLFSYQQCFTVLRYIPTIRGQLLQFIIHKCLEMDVEIKIKDCGEVTIEEKTKNKDEELCFSMDLEENKIDDRNKMVDEMADKLDSLMLHTFEQIENTVKLKQQEKQQQDMNSDNCNRDNNHNSSGSSSDNNNVDTPRMEAGANVTTASSSVSNICGEFYATIAPVFEASIITTYKSKFVQFLIFFLCGLEKSTMKNKQSSSLSSPLYREFAATLIDIFVDPYRASTVRQSAVCYLASFTSRASFVCSETICESICALLKWADVYMDLIDKSNGSSTTNNNSNNYTLDYYNMRAHAAASAREQCDLHALFYTVCQAAFYIMCFRGKEAIEFYRSAVTKMNVTIGNASAATTTVDESDGYNNNNGNELKDYDNNEEEEEDDDILDLEVIDIGPKRWRKLCCHTLQPLRYCLESVRSEFLTVSKILNLFQLDDNNDNNTNNNNSHNNHNPITSPMAYDTRKQEQDRFQMGLLNIILKESYYHNPSSTTRAPLSRRRSGKKLKAASSKIMTAATMEKERRKGGVGGLGLGTNPLDSFFPFDPYLLRQSYQYIEPLYIHWNESLNDTSFDFDDEQNSVATSTTADGEPGDTSCYRSNSHSDDDCSSSSSSSEKEELKKMSFRYGDSSKADYLSQTMATSSATVTTTTTTTTTTSTRQEVPREPWANILKRARAPSVETGSW